MPAVERPPLTLFLCGDVMTGRGLDQALPHPSRPDLHESYVASAREYLEMAEKAHGPIARPLSFSYIWGDALQELERRAPAARIINLETSITTSEDYAPKDINYRMHPGNTPCLSAAKIDCCALANNHVLDWGPSGLLETLHSLHQAGIRTAGAGGNIAEALQPAVLELGRDSRVLVFALGSGDSGIPAAWDATDTQPGIALLTDLSERQAQRVAERVRAIRRSGDITVLSLHWGDNWGYQIPRNQQDFAHRLIDLEAADLVHGHSSHHPKGIEIYRGKPILYGCGDLLNDYEGISGYEEFRGDLALMYFATIDPATRSLLRLEMAALQMRRLQLHRTRRPDAEWLRDTLNREGGRLGTGVLLNGENHLMVHWRH